MAFLVLACLFLIMIILWSQISVLDLNLKLQ